jgi:tellurite methyltransferase
MGALSFSDCTFDGLVAYNVVYHATLAGMQDVLGEVRRVLRPGGRLYVTVIARDDSKVAACQADVRVGKCREIEPFTFVYPRFDDAPDDKYLPHHYCDEAELHALLADFAIGSMWMVGGFRSASTITCRHADASCARCRFGISYTRF